MIITETTKKITVSYGKEEIEILKKAADILQKITDNFINESSSREITDIKSNSFYIANLADAINILYTLSDTTYLFSEQKENY